ncbi:MAG: hypothetical protein WCD45_06840 [Gallionella sp.]
MKKLITRSTVIPAQAGIQMVKKVTRIAGQYISVVRHAKILVLLDSRLRGNDAE